MSSDIITIEIDETRIKCEKQVLIRNSDYFRVMLEGEFVERNMSIIKLEGVDLRAMNIILTLLVDETHFVEYEDILIVLQTACMLQFVQISHLVLDRIAKILCPTNCLKVWIVTEELAFSPICLKAKFMAMDEFMVIKDSECIQELTLEQLCSYVGHVNLRTDNELFVFQTVMSWWLRNGCLYEENSTVTLLKLLSCVNYQNLSNLHFEEILGHPSICNNNLLKDTLGCIYNRKKGLPIAEFSQISQDYCQMLYSAKCRIKANCPCFVVQTERKAELELKRKLQAHFGLSLNKNFKKEDLKPEFHVIHYDPCTNGFKRFFDIENSKCRNLEGFKLVNYKQSLLMFGGQYKIGRGSWNYNFWMFDPLRDKWVRKTVLPDPRRHFESSITDGKVFILGGNIDLEELIPSSHELFSGGAGNFRVNQEDLYWYDIENDNWSGTIKLRFKERQLKCCEFLNKYFIFSINKKCGFFLSRDADGKLKWLFRKLEVEDSILHNEGIFELVPYKDKLYVKGKKLIEFGLVEDKLKMLSVKDITDVDYDALAVTMCDNLIYTMYKFRNLGDTLYSLEKYDLETGAIENIFTNNKGMLEIDGKRFQIRGDMNLFSFKHYILTGNDLINHSFL